MAQAKTKTEETTPAGNRYKVAVGDTLVFRTGDTIHVLKITGVSEKRGGPSIQTVNTFNVSDVAELLND